MFKEEVQTTKGYLKKKIIKEVQEVPSYTKKMKERLQIQEEVFDTQDSIADNAKIISLMLSMMSRIYTSLDETTKSNLSTDDRTLIEYTFTKFASTNTRADVQFAADGAVLTIDKLMDRQGAIGTIVS